MAHVYSLKLYYFNLLYWHSNRDGVIVIGNGDNFTVIVIVTIIVIDREEMKVIIIVIDGQVIYNSLLLLYYIILFSLDYLHQFNLSH